jgi:phosphatidate cytidylyltransferase
MTSSPSAKPFDWRNLALRVASTAILAPAVVLIVWFGGWPFVLMLLAASAMLTVEWGKMSAPGSPIRTALTMGVATAVAAIIAAAGFYHLAWGALALGAAAAALVTRIRGLAERPSDAAFGVMYVGAPLVALIWLRGEPSGAGRAWTLLVLAITWGADIAAFLVGSVLRGPKLWPRISPNKTWSGFIGGLAAAAGAGAAMAALSEGPVSPTLIWGAFIGLVGGLATMAGDLLESMMKRRFGVKDSGDLIPGHGGLLDRVDGLMIAVLVVAAARFVAGGVLS